MPKWILTTLLSWIAGHVKEYVTAWLNKREQDKKAKALALAYQEQAESVKRIADEIECLIKLNIEVPESLKERLRHESRILADQSNLINGS